MLTNITACGLEKSRVWEHCCLTCCLKCEIKIYELIFEMLKVFVFPGKVVSLEVAGFFGQRRYVTWRNTKACDWDVSHVPECFATFHFKTFCHAYSSLPRMACSALRGPWCPGAESSLSVCRVCRLSAQLKHRCVHTTVFHLGHCFCWACTSLSVEFTASSHKVLCGALCPLWLSVGF